MPARAWNTPQWHIKAEDVAKRLADHIKGKTVLVTGVSPNSLGAYFVGVLAPYDPRLVVLASRSLPNLEKCQAELTKEHPRLNTRILRLDLSDLAQVREAARELNGCTDIPTIDVLVNNAGVAGSEKRKEVNGFEQQFVTNHLGHFLFTNLVMKKVVKAAQENGEARIVNVSSRGHMFSPVLFDDINLEKVDWHPMIGYGHSKTANILFSVALADRLASKGVKAYSLHPGSSWTGLVRDMTIEELTSRGWADKDRNPTDSDAMRWKTVSQGTATHVVACFDPAISGKNGAYLQDTMVETEDVKDYAVDKGNAKRLWEVSEELVGEKFSL